MSCGRGGTAGLLLPLAARRLARRRPAGAVARVGPRACRKRFPHRPRDADAVLGGKGAQRFTCASGVLIDWLERYEYGTLHVTA